MTITTAKRRLPAAPRLAPLALALAALLAAPAHAQQLSTTATTDAELAPPRQWTFTPEAGATETYTDNVNLANSRQARGQFVSEAYAAFDLAGATRRLKLDASASEHQFLFSRGGVPGTNDRQLVYRMAGEATLLDDLLYLDASASGGPQAISAFGPQVTNNLYALGNRADVHTWSISPSVRHRFGHSADLAMSYSRDGVDAGARNPFGSSTGSTASAQLTSGRLWRDLGWGLSYMRQDLHNRITGPSSSRSALANVSLRLGREFALTGSGGYDKYDYQSLGGRTAGRNWSAGFVWTPSSRTQVKASGGRRYFGKTGAFDAVHRARHGVWHISYTDMVTTTRAQFLLPATLDTATLLDSLFLATIPDPVARAEAVRNYMRATGLPSTLTDNVNYMSNRYIRQKDFQVATVLKGAHSDLAVGLYDTTRIALSAQSSDSELLGSELLALNDSTRQRGVHALWSYRVSPRTTALLAANVGRTRSLSTGYVNHTNLLRVGVTRRFSRSLYGALEVRHAGGGLGAGTGQTYRENAVSATISMQLN